MRPIGTASPCGFVLARPAVFAALDPRYALAYLGHADSWIAFTVLGSVFLALTGGEALYADMGHFGRRAIRIDWFLLVMPAIGATAVLHSWGSTMTQNPHS